MIKLNNELNNDELELVFPTKEDKKDKLKEFTDKYLNEMLKE